MQTLILDDIINVTQLLKKSKLHEEILVPCSKELERLERYFRVKRSSVFLLIAIFELNSRDNFVTYESIAKLFDVNVLRIVKLTPEINFLLKQGYIEEDMKLRFFIGGSKERLRICDTIKAAILENRPIELEKNNPLSEPMDIILHLCEMIEERENCGGPTAQLLNLILKFLKNNLNKKICEELYDINLKDIDRAALIFIVARNLEGLGAPSVGNVSGVLMTSKTQRRKFEVTLDEGSSDLISGNWVELKEASFFSSAEVILTQKAMDFFADLEVNILIARTKNKDVVKPEMIIKQNLYFPDDVKAKVEQIENALKPRSYQRIIESLNKESMRTGVCVLYYGLPGTGKTESAYQIAKQTGRAIWKVDMSALKSMWFGESQKLAKSLFTDYKQLCVTEKHTPILLLNEADAILGKRNTSAVGSTDKTDNAIQNIFLENFESFEGILIATTNLESSLDSAFERRFLYKLEFTRPDLDTQIKIWKSKVKGLRTNQAQQLVEKFNLSGGEIENVVRKLKIDNVLNGNHNRLKRLIQFSEEEKLNNNKINSMGFRS